MCSQWRRRFIMIFSEARFIKALPVWERGMQRELNHALKFTADVGKYTNALLRISGHTGYQVFINGEFVHYGPARAGRGYYRVDEIRIEKYLTRDENTLVIIATGYFCDSFEWLKEPSFICAEIEADREIVAYTGGTGFTACRYIEKLKKVQRYSYQRPFAEVYDFARVGNAQVPTAACEEKKFIKREISYPEFPHEPLCVIYGGGSVAFSEPERYFEDRAIVNAGGSVDGFAPSRTETISIHLAQRLKLKSEQGASRLPAYVKKNGYISAYMKSNTTGFIELELHAQTDTELYLTFDETLTRGEIDFTRNNTSNVLLYSLIGGRDYKLVTVQPYTFKYINIISVGGSVELRYAGMIRCDFNESEIVKSLDTSRSDGEIERIYNAAVETFRQNTFDIFMDCPSRERAGWLCDSFFTARVERLMSGKNTVERCFLSNFLMEEKYKGIPEGMLPMCYPSEFRNPEYIPNWAMWYLLELKEYYDRTGDRSLIDDARSKIHSLVRYFEEYENPDGLLERLDGWVFVEWSMCNKLVQDINYPTNMLYYRFLMTVYELYGYEKYRKKAQRLRDVIRKNSKSGLFFCDNSVYLGGKLTLSGEFTETCQYYAFFTGVATIEEDRELWDVMVRDFGPERSKTGKWKSIHPSNAFIGNYLRLELLAGAGLYGRLEADIRGYFDYMAKQTGTLWEHDREGASCNHGFASHVLVWLDMLGYII